jgi:hypothetical protein
MAHDHLPRRDASPSLDVDRTAHRVQPLQLLCDTSAPQPHGHHSEVVVVDRGVTLVRNKPNDRDCATAPQQSQSVQ